MTNLLGTIRRSSMYNFPVKLELGRPPHRKNEWFDPYVARVKYQYCNYDFFILRSGCCMKYDINVAVWIFHPRDGCQSFVCVMLQLLFINIATDHLMKKFLSNFQTLIVPKKKCLRQGTPTTMTDVAVGFLYDFYCDRHMMILHEEFKFTVDILVHYWCCNSYFQILLWRAYDDFTMFNLVQYDNMCGCDCHFQYI
jgi:hypothetical protein